MIAGWKQVPLGDVVDIIGGGTPSKKTAAFYGGDIPWATVRDMGGFNLTNTEHSITSKGLANSSSNVIPSGEVIVATRVGLGKVCILRQDTAINQDLRGLVPQRGSELDRRFLFYWFRSKADEVVAAGTGATVQGVKLPFIKSLLIPLPLLEEQRRIVAVLDEAFEGLDRARINAEANLQNARELFESFREHAFEVALEGDFNWRPLSELIEIKHGFAFKSAAFVDEGQYAVLTPGNFYEQGGFRERVGKQRYYSAEFPEEFLLKKGDLLVAMTEQAPGLLGSTIVVPQDEKYLHNQRLGLITPRQDVTWLASFFAYAFNLKSLRKGLSDTCSGATVRHTSPKRILAEAIPYAHDIEQMREISERLSAHDHMLQQAVKGYNDKLADLDDLRQSILQKAFSGGLAVSKQYLALGLAANDNSQRSAQIVALAYSRHLSADNQKTFGHVKAQKVLNLSEALCSIDLGREPIQDRAGPNDKAHLEAMEEWAEANQVFKFRKRPSGGYTFEPLANFDATVREAQATISEQMSQFNVLMELLVPMDTEDAEVFATVHAAWNNLIIDDAEINNEAIVAAAREDWHEDKLKIVRQKFFDAIALIKNESIEPDGSAKYVHPKPQSQTDMFAGA